MNEELNKKIKLAIKIFYSLMKIEEEFYLTEELFNKVLKAYKIPNEKFIEICEEIIFSNGYELLISKKKFENNFFYAVDITRNTVPIFSSNFKELLAYAFYEAMQEIIRDYRRKKPKYIFKGLK